VGNLIGCAREDETIISNVIGETLDSKPIDRKQCSLCGRIDNGE